MQQSEHQYHELSISNNSSVITPQTKKRGGDFNKDVLVFSSIVKKGQFRQGNEKNCDGQKEQLMSNYSHNGSKKENKKLRKNSDQTELNYQLPKTVVTPCQDLFGLFIDHKLSAEYVQMMQKNKFKNLVIISVILPAGLMKKLSKFIDFSQQYRISISQTPFTTDFIPLNSNNNDQNEANYVFWTYQVSENEQNLRSSINKGNGKPNISSVRSMKQMRNKKQVNVDQYNNNLRSLMVEMSQIVITTKKYIQNHSELFLSASPDLTGSSYQFLSPIHLYELDIERTLLYFDEQQITQSIKSIPTPRYLENSSQLIEQIKRKKVQDPSHIQIEPDQESYDFDDEQKGRVHFIDKIQTSRSREIPALSQEGQNDEKLQFLEVLQTESIFKRIENLLPFWIDNDSSYKIQSNAKKQTKKRKGSLGYTTLELEKCQKFQLFLAQQVRNCLKRNHTYSMFCSSWICLHFLTNFYQNSINIEQKKVSSTIELSKHHFNSYSGILMRSLKTFKKQIQLRFIQKVENEHKDLTDEVTLRQILRNIKKDELIFIKKNLNSVRFPNYSNLKNDKSYVFSHQQTPINKEYLTEIQHELISFMDKLQEDIYFQNNKQAVIYNQKILESEYQRIVQSGFRRQILKKKSSTQSSNPSLESDEKSFINADSISKKKISSEMISSEIQKNFNDFIDAYWTKGVKVSSQLKTFNDFMEKYKKQYLKNINLLTKQQKSHQKEEQQRENKKRTIKLLEMEILKLQNKKREVKEKNKLIKNQAKNIEEKIQLLEKNESKIQRQNTKRQGRSMEYSRTEKFNQQSNRKKGNLQSSETEEKRFSKSPGLSFQIQNKKKDRNKKDTEKMSPSKLSKNQNRKIKRTSFERNLQTREQIKAEQKRNKNRCLNICCVIM